MSEMTDRIYYDAPDSGLVLDEEGGRPGGLVCSLSKIDDSQMTLLQLPVAIHRSIPGGPLSLIKSNFSDAVYWNIWEEGAAGMVSEAS
jgi:hypothetical protein